MTCLNCTEPVLFVLVNRNTVVICFSVHYFILLLFHTFFNSKYQIEDFFVVLRCDAETFSEYGCIGGSLNIGMKTVHFPREIFP